MNTYDLTPLFRHSIGFDHLEDIFDSMVRLNSYSDNYPPYNIRSNGKDQYAIELAVAGFDEKDLSVDLENGQLTIIGTEKTLMVILCTKELQLVLSKEDSNLPNM